MDLLRFVTAGSVDDGKSTLIGRLLFDTKTIFKDQLEAVEHTSKVRGEDFVNLALLTDGLRSEREQGITIDVAYRYFATPKRKFILADSPGHVQYTRNMITGASNASLSLILVDARNGVLEQTRRHTFISALLGIKHLIVCINKMDLVDFNQDIYQKIKEDYRAFSSKIDVPDIRFIPLSAKEGDNVVRRSEKMDWYQGPTLLYALENTYVESDYERVNCRFPVQYVLRPMKEAFHDYRGYAGRVAGGIFKKGDEVVVLPSGFKSRIKSIENVGKEVDQVFPPMSASIQLENDIDISRGDMIVKEFSQPNMNQDIDIMLCWFTETPLAIGSKFIIKHTTREVKAILKDVRYKVDINTLHRIQDDKHIGLNDIGRVHLRTSSPLIFDTYKKNKITGSVILIDEKNNYTVAAGMIL
ncbi:MAG: sulfate adenylyltransferase [Bacteroidetes bacterium]|nr:sulfate adenylyltransferase [Bacteroidota bacterium]MBL6963298.1 sulfate adenylyltransferase [Bacteroidota bacterium]